MCRITGIIDRKTEQIKLDTVCMRDAMKHGGPDHAGIFINQDATLALGHRRLSIIDLSDVGNQPMISEDGKVALVFNGEIYNYRELKAELVQAGFTFFSHSDTEVIIKAYQHWGTCCFSRFRGMFALALLDEHRQELILARDHAGIKPLYYYCDNECLYFASEIRAFKELNSNWEENPDWKVFFLTYGYLPFSVTTLKGVQPLEKGSFKVFNTRTLQSRQSFFYEDAFTEEITCPTEAKELVRKALEQAVERHLIADAPIGLFLSGGIDSSLLTLLAKKYKKELHTLSIVFNDANYSEKQYQDIIVEKVGSKHQRFSLNKEIFLHDLPDITKAMDQPSSDGINSYFISKFAKEAGLKAVLSGLGADELFGGYASFKRTELLKNIRFIPGLFFSAAQALPQDKFRKLSFLKTKTALGEHLFNRGYFTPAETARLLDRDVKEVQLLLESIPVPAFVSTVSEGNRVSFFENNWYMQHQLLRDTDVMSMWHSIEVRVPFLDYDLIKIVQKISSSVKFNNRQSKYLLIDSFRDILPEQIWNRKKQGFVFPFDVWMKDYADQLASDKQSMDLNKKFKAGKLTWSRYWTYLVSQSFVA